METLSKLETAAVLSAVRAVMDSAPSPLADSYPLKTAAKKLDNNLKELKKEGTGV